MGAWLMDLTTGRGAAAMAIGAGAIVLTIAGAATAATGATANPCLLTTALNPLMGSAV